MATAPRGADARGRTRSSRISPASRPLVFRGSGQRLGEALESIFPPNELLSHDGRQMGGRIYVEHDLRVMPAIAFGHRSPQRLVVKESVLRMWSTAAETDDANAVVARPAKE